MNASLEMSSQAVGAEAVAIKEYSPRNDHHIYRTVPHSAGKNNIVLIAVHDVKTIGVKNIGAHATAILSIDPEKAEIESN